MVDQDSGHAVNSDIATSLLNEILATVIKDQKEAKQSISTQVVGNILEFTILYKIMCRPNTKFW